MLTALDLIKEQVSTARDVFMGTIRDVKASDLHKDPGGKALPIAAIYAHLIFSEDKTIHTFLQGKQALFESTWKKKTGASAQLPLMDESWEKNHESWAKSVTLDLPKFQKYEKAVYQATDAYLSSISAKDLENEIDMGNWGKQKVAYLLHAYIIGHMNNLAGEASATKGVFGAKGYQF